MQMPDNVYINPYSINTNPKTLTSTPATLHLRAIILIKFVKNCVLSIAVINYDNDYNMVSTYFHKALILKRDNSTVWILTLAHKHWSDIHVSY